MFDFHLEDAAGNRYWGRTGYASLSYVTAVAESVLASAIPGKYVDRAVIYRDGKPAAIIFRNSL